jgi:hypothetical protein
MSQQTKTAPIKGESSTEGPTAGTFDPEKFGSLVDAFGALALYSPLAPQAAKEGMLQLDGGDGQPPKQSFNAKMQGLNNILEAESIEDCFQIVPVTLKQPACFAPSIERDKLDSTFVVTLPEGVNSLLYGDGGMVKANEGQEACAAATINYYTEDALKAIDLSQQVFATLVCIGRFSNAKLPMIGENINYMDILNNIAMPESHRFTAASISAAEDTAAGPPVYTTIITLNTKDQTGIKRLNARFTSQKDDASLMRKGKLAVFLSSRLTEAPKSIVNPPPLGQQGPGGQQQGPGGQQMRPGGQQQGLAGHQMGAGPGGMMLVDQIQTLAVVAQYDILGEHQKISLDRGDFFSSGVDDNPIKFIDREGHIDFAAIALLGAGQRVAQNFVSTAFETGLPLPLISQGRIGWAASLNDGFWRTFAYRVSLDEDGGQVAHATYGFAPSLVDGKVLKPKAPVGMFCGWAKGTSAVASESNLIPTNLSGPGTNRVQLQVAHRQFPHQPFAANDEDNHLAYTATGGCGENNKLFAVNEFGEVQDFLPPPELVTDPVEKDLPEIDDTVDLDPTL